MGVVRKQDITIECDYVIEDSLADLDNYVTKDCECLCVDKTYNQCNIYSEYKEYFDKGIIKRFDNTVASLEYILKKERGVQNESI